MHKHTPAPTLLLGGSFNPPHIGHFRMALEAMQRQAPQKVLFIPVASPPHKPHSNLLPFSLRVEMLRQSISGLPGCDICTIENERPGPSYTFDTLTELSQRYPDTRLQFILGGEDFSVFSTWNRWKEIPALADLLILPRGPYGPEAFYNTARNLWPEASPVSMACSSGTDMFLLPDGGKLIYIEQPRLEISSSLIRSRWLTDENIMFLTTPEVLDILENNRDIVRSVWLG